MQSNFRFFVSVRDSQCLITGAEAENCTAAHIVPQSRPDVRSSKLSIYFAYTLKVVSTDPCVEEEPANVQPIIRDLARGRAP